MNLAVPKVNRAAVQYAAGDLRIETRPLPVPGPRQVLVGIHAVGICGSDVHYHEQGRAGDYVLTAPMVAGHEASGTVLANGPGASLHPVGTRVALEPTIPCRECRSCVSGHYNLCPNVTCFATPPTDGVIADVIVHDERQTFAVPDTMSFEAAALVEPLSVAVHALRRGQVGIGDDVFITGAGPVGLLSAAVARSAGARSVIISDVHEWRLGRAAEFGATATHDSRGGSAHAAGVEADVFIDCSGSPQAVADGFACLRRSGRLVLVGIGADELTFPVDGLLSREITVTGSFRYAGDFPAAIAVAASKAFDLDALVTHRFDLEDTEKALTCARNDPHTLKPVVMVRE